MVCIGGGTGLSVILRGLKKLPVDITAIVTVADDGGSSGRLRNDLQMPPPGDIRNVLVALADTEPLLESVFQYRFENGEGLAGHTLGNLMIAAMKEITGDFTQAVREMSRVLAVRGRVLPASEQDVVLLAEMSDGTIVKGESQIPKMGKRIRRVFLNPPDPKPLDEALRAIEEADGIIMGPGSLYTSILPNLLVKDMSESIRSSPAVKIYICNVMTQPGETDGFTASDHIKAIYDHVGDRLFEIAIINNEVPPLSIQKQYAVRQQRMVIPDIERIHKLGCHVLADNLLLYQSVLRHDADRISRHILRLIREEIQQRQSV
ncbi:YvcK family protein [Paenactinomyces guangxiensis]|uniref:Gluconeogenesis factor n=1 Tax=Paenactinomyces guangxiensis TaxID=1490290 RepID=A0A7W2A928_9BACL|nr:YvcK family protein [Paenactinomyces guangxiensis]MBH8593290.1 YvcK family protein [Paenactinomyces guangxiensis]